MRLTTAVTVQNFLEKAAQPALFAGITYWYYDQNTGKMPGVGAGTALVLNTIGTLFFTEKTGKVKNTLSLSRIIIIPLTSTAINAILECIKNSKLQIKNTHLFVFLYLVGLKIAYDCATLIISFVAHAVLKIGVESTLAEGLDRIKAQRREGVAACSETLHLLHKTLEPFESVDFAAHPLFKQCIETILAEGLDRIKEQRREGINVCGETLHLLHKTLEPFKSVDLAAHPLFRECIETILAEGLERIKEQRKEGISPCCETLHLLHKTLEPFKSVDLAAHPLFRECVQTVLAEGLDRIKAERKWGINACVKTFQFLYKMLAPFKSVDFLEFLRLLDKTLEPFESVNFADHPLFSQCIETILAEELDLTKPQEEAIADAWHEINRTIRAEIDSVHFLTFIPPNNRAKTFSDLSNQHKHKIANKLAKQGITFYNSKVFSISTLPELIFKKLDKKDFDILIKHKYICWKLQLTELFIPNSKFIQINDMTFVVQKKLDYNSSKQPYYYLKYASRLNKAVEQLKVYIFETGEADVEWRNMPVIGNLKGNSPLQIAIIDHEYKPEDRPEWGIVGCDSLKRTGLIGLLCEEQAKKIATWALKQDLFRVTNTEAVARALQKRIITLGYCKSKLAEDQKFKDWANKKNRKSNLPIDSSTKLIQSFNSFLSERNPKDYPSRRSLRTIGMRFKSFYHYELNKMLDNLKREDEIFSFSQLNTVDELHGFANGSTVYLITA